MKLGLLYRQIAQELKSDIESGVYANGAPFPSETILQKYYGVSRDTVRSALALLKEEGLIERRKGSGTTVHCKAYHKMLQRIVDFHSEAKTLGRKPNSKVLSCSTRKSNIRERIQFDIRPQGKVVELRRLRYLDGVPVILQTSSHPADILEGMKVSDLNDRSLYSYLQSRKGIVVRDAEQVLEPFTIGDEDARLLDVSAGTAVFRAYRTTRDTTGRVLELAENLIRGDYVKYTFQFSAEEVGEETVTKTSIIV